MSVHAVPLNPGGRRGSGAFTLVELLIVIAIIAILVTIIMPTVRSALAMARQATCSTNHRAICQALQAYHGDNDAFPYNYGDYQIRDAEGNIVVDYDDGGGLNGRERWALGCLAPYLAGKNTPIYLRGLDEGEFPNAYICPAADLDMVHGDNATDKYHACYWTNICIRANRGWGKLFDNQGWTDQAKKPMPPGWDGDSGWAARISGWKICSRCHNWRSVYNPTLQSVPVPEKTVFTGDTNNNPSDVGHDADGNEFSYEGRSYR
ncbi:MAG TPA: prepilin-type N-terminal cleavage/methylation domain-containing protein, partial [Phycisphaerae bacterium]|nr:prepilin-type N-terminal cleavage/methylation domain-containing protein [Phycisphaerae bacterium]